MLPSGHPDQPWLVVVNVPIPALDFAPPHEYMGTAPLGCRVLVPWRAGLAVGLVVGLSEQRGRSRLREVVSVLDEPDCPWVRAGTVQGLSEWAAQARVPLGLLWGDLLGIGWEPEYDHRVRAVDQADLSAFAAAHPHSPLPGPDWQDAEPFTAKVLDQIREQGLLEEKITPKAPQQRLICAMPLEQVPAAARSVTRLGVTQTDAPLTPKQQQACTWLAQHGPVNTLSAWAKGAGVSSGVVKAALEAGGADYLFQPAPPPEAWTWLRAHGPVEHLTQWATGAGVSASAVGTLLARGWAQVYSSPLSPPALPQALPQTIQPEPQDRLPEAATWRLHGGKTTSRFQVLAPRLRRLLQQGRSVLVLAPDRATLRRAWQALSFLGQEAGTQAVQLSGPLAPWPREYTWNLIRRGEARLVIGSPLALTAPLDDLALVVVLEEGSDAYKLRSGSRAFVPDVVQVVAKAQDAAVAWVGSTPAVESVISPGAVLSPPRARIHVVDYSQPPAVPTVGPLSSPHLAPGDLGYPISHDLARLLRQVQERGRQAVLLAPRRGYSALLHCPSCEHVPQCRNCDVPLRFHQETRLLTCHQCGYRQGVPERCDHCGERLWRAKGPGTEWIAAEVRKLLPELGVYRLDKDRQDDLSALYAGEPGVLVGTQLLLSHDAPPNLALLGITLADTWLSVSDFRASERYHRLLRQLVEWHPNRAPLLLVQTFQGQHPALKVLLDGKDALAYPAAEERVRLELGYPPHAYLAQIEITARQSERAKTAAQELAQALLAAGATPGEVLGPAPSPIARLRGVYPYHLLLRTRHQARLAELLRVIDTRNWPARLRVDVGPRGG